MEQKIVKLTSLSMKTPVYINVNMIGHFYEVEEKIEYGRVQKPKHTRVGVTTHNNGGFEIVETPEKILKLING